MTKKPITIPENVKIEIDGQKILVKGAKGELEFIIHKELKVNYEDNKILLTPKNEKEIGDKKLKSLWGLDRALIFNMIKGVSEGYQKQLKIEGIGYKAEVKNGN